MIDDDDIKENPAEETSSAADAASEATPAPDAAAASETKEETPADAAKPAEDGVKEYTPESFDEQASTEAKKEEDGNKDEEDDEPKEKTITVQPVQFASFEEMEQVKGPQNQNLNILLDVKLQLSVELGKTDLPIKKVLELTKGSIVTLNKAAGEPVELYANGKLIAFGEVVVIEDNFGLRITHITDPVKRLNTINGGARED